jgi:Fur family ferric uptake transcriptional regulator
VKNLPNQNEFENLLTNRNLKRTKTRILVLEVLKDSSPKTVDEIFSVLYQNNMKLSLSTVYRTCETLTEKGILSKVNLTDDGVARYEYMKSEHTHHAICLGCNKIIPIDDCPYGQFDQIMKSKYGFDVKSHHIEIYGYCQDCIRKKEKKE